MILIRKNVYKVLTFENISFESVGVFLKYVLKMVVSKQLRAFYLLKKS